MRFFMPQTTGAITPQATGTLPRIIDPIMADIWLMGMLRTLRVILHGLR